MHPELEAIPLIHNVAKKHFELHFSNHTTFIEYNNFGNQVALIHTIIPEILSGKGIGTALVEKTLLYLKENNKTILPFCPFIFSYLKKHPEWKILVDTRFKKYDEL